MLFFLEINSWNFSRIDMRGIVTSRQARARLREKCENLLF